MAAVGHGARITNGLVGEGEGPKLEDPPARVQEGSREVFKESLRVERPERVDGGKPGLSQGSEKAAGFWGYGQAGGVGRRPGLSLVLNLAGRTSCFREKSSYISLWTKGHSSKHPAR